MNTHPPSILLYAVTTCGYCRAAKQFLETNGLTYRIIEIDVLPGPKKEAKLQELRKINPACTVPTISPYKDPEHSYPLYPSVRS